MERTSSDKNLPENQVNRTEADDSQTNDETPVKPETNTVHSEELRYDNADEIYR